MLNWLFCNLLVHAVEFYYAIPNQRGISVVLLCHAAGHAGSVILAFILAVLKDWDALWIVSAFNRLFHAMLLNTLERVTDSQDLLLCGLIASLSLSAFGHIDSRLAAFAGEA